MYELEGGERSIEFDEKRGEEVQDFRKVDWDRERKR
jgi:hypothetical protein